jgi:protein TonB
MVYSFFRVENDMTGTYNRIPKNWTLIFFFAVALAVHVAILGLPVKTGGPSRLQQIMSVRLIPSKTFTAPVSHGKPTVTSQPEAPLYERSKQPSRPVASAKPHRVPKTRVPPETQKRKTQVKQPKQVTASASLEDHTGSDQPNENQPPVDKPSLQPGTDRSDVSASDAMDSFETASIADAVKNGGADGRESLENNQGTVTYARPRYKHNPPPRYPRIAKRRGYEGRTVLQVEVFETGEVGTIVISQSSGFDVLDQAALKSVKHWTFVPGTENGKPVRQWVAVPVRFDLK